MAASGRCSRAGRDTERCRRGVGSRRVPDPFVGISSADGHGNR